MHHPTLARPGEARLTPSSPHPPRPRRCPLFWPDALARFAWSRGLPALVLLCVAWHARSCTPTARVTGGAFDGRHPPRRAGLRSHQPRWLRATNAGAADSRRTPMGSGGPAARRLAQPSGTARVPTRETPRPGNATTAAWPRWTRPRASSRRTKALSTSRSLVIEARVRDGALVVGAQGQPAPGRPTTASGV